MQFWVWQTALNECTLRRTVVYVLHNFLRVFCVFVLPIFCSQSVTVNFDANYLAFNYC